MPIYPLQDSLAFACEECKQEEIIKLPDLLSALRAVRGLSWSVTFKLDHARVLCPNCQENISLTGDKKGGKT